MARSVRIDSADHEELERLAKQTSRSMSDLMTQAIRDLKRRFILEATCNGYRQLQQDEAAWSEELADREAWDAATLADADPDDRA